MGDPDPARNPLARAHAPALAALAGGPWTAELAPAAAPGVAVAHVDATMDDPRTPQSATGQATLLTGSDAVALMEGPYGPWPGPRLRELLAADNLFLDVQRSASARAGSAALANAYPAAYLDALARPAGRHRRVRAPAAVVAAEAAGVPLRDLQARSEGRAVAPDLDGGGLVRLDPRSGAADAAREARRLAAIAGDHAFTYLDVWVTDQVGHRADLALATALVERLDRFVDALWSALPAHVTLLVTSDHGNLEDAGDRRHTRAPVPLIARGPAAAAFAAVRDLRQVAPAVRAAWDAQKPTSSAASYQAPTSSSSPAGTSSEAALRTACG